MDHAEEIVRLFKESTNVAMQFAQTDESKISWLVDIIVKVFRMNNKLILFGNGGSAADASHIAGEFVNRFKINRKGLPAISLGTDMAVITSISNDFSYTEIFSRQVEVFANENDIVFAFSTSGNSENVILGVEAAKKKNVFTVGFTGNAGKLKDIVDVNFSVPSSDTPRIQECHMILCHVICELVEKLVFKTQNPKT